MNAVPDNILNQNAELDPQVTAPLPGSRKIYVPGSRADLQVPMREIAQQPSVSKGVPLANKPVYVYDTSGPYTDPDRTVDIRKGLPPLPHPRHRRNPRSKPRSRSGEPSAVSVSARSAAGSPAEASAKEGGRGYTKPLPFVSLRVHSWFTPRGAI